MDTPRNNSPPVPQASPIPSSTLPPNPNRQHVWMYINTHLQTCNFGGQEQRYLAKPDFEKATTVDIITAVVLQDLELRISDEEKPGFAAQIHKEGRKLFITCVYATLSMEFLRALLDHRLKDKHFPLSNQQYPSLVHMERFVSSFFPNQRYFTVPFLGEGFFKNFDGQTQIPIDFDDGEKNCRGRGAFGSVYEVKIDRDQHLLPHGVECEFSKDRKGHSFAMKVVKLERTGRREMDFVDATKHIVHEYYARCFASWTIGHKYYMIYDLADCNLKEFMQNHPEGMHHSCLTSSWLIQQMCGIAGALNEVHTVKPGQNIQRSNDVASGGLGVPQTQGKNKAGYLHDIRPENILVFKRKNNGFRLCDWSCAKVKDFMAVISGADPASRKTTTGGKITYKPPESHSKGETGRPYDLWSLGCVFLELLVWFWEGLEALDEFRTNRLGKVDLDAGFEDDKFYCVIPGGEKGLRISVQHKIDELSTVLDEDLKKVLEIIPDLLKINQQDRLKAEGLVERFAGLNICPSLMPIKTDALSFKANGRPVIKIEEAT